MFGSKKLEGRLNFYLNDAALDSIVAEAMIRVKLSTRHLLVIAGLSKRGKLNYEHRNGGG